MTRTAALCVALSLAACTRSTAPRLAEPTTPPPAASAQPAAPAQPAPEQPAASAATPAPPAAPAVPEGCTDAGALALFGLQAGDRVLARCVTLDATRVFVAWQVTSGDTGTTEPCTLHVAVVEGARLAWRGTETLTDTVDVESWSQGDVARVTGAAQGFRVGVVGTRGEDFRASRERVIVFRAEGDGYVRAWTGGGREEEHAMDACHVVTTRDFRFASPRSLEITRTGAAQFQNQPMPRAQLAQIRRNCREPAMSTERIPLPQ